jgi:pimeloyl-ACP methyl ester carboxylesterase
MRRFCTKGALAAAALAVTSGCGSILFPAPAATVAPRAQGAELLRLPTPEEDAVALWAPPQTGRSVVVFFHGNAGQIGDLGWLVETLASDGTGVLLVEYPGYGVAAGSPSEASIYRSAARALDELPKLGVDRAHTVLVGQSLGSGVAAEMAMRGYGSRLMLISPFTSIADLVDGLVPFGLGGLFVTDKFDTLSKARGMKIETVIAHGDVDWIVPVEMGRELAHRIPGARLEVFEGGGHNDMFGRDGDRLVELIRALSSGR